MVENWINKSFSSVGATYYFSNIIHENFFYVQTNHYNFNPDLTSPPLGVQIAIGRVKDFYFNIVCFLSGPTETIFIGTSTSFSIKSI